MKGIVKPQEVNRAPREAITVKSLGVLSPGALIPRDNHPVAVVLEGLCRTVEVCEDSKLGAESSVYKSSVGRLWLRLRGMI